MTLDQLIAQLQEARTPFTGEYTVEVQVGDGENIAYGDLSTFVVSEGAITLLVTTGFIFT